jgi:hypothetical protein
METMETTIREYFRDFFTGIKFYTGSVNGLDAIGFDGWRNGNKYSFSTNQVGYPGEMLFHWLENIKGEIVASEKTILLEK